MAENVGVQQQASGKRLRLGIWATAACMLLVPLVAMQFTDQVAWDVADFVLFGALLLGSGLAIELVIRMTPSIAYRSAVGVAIAAAFLLIWVNGAVGIIGSESNDVNALFAGVLIVGVVGALIARLRSQGMARTLLAMALLQILIAAVALSAGWGRAGSAWPWDLILATGFFSALWLSSAVLFQRAARKGYERNEA